MRADARVDCRDKGPAVELSSPEQDRIRHGWRRLFGMFLGLFRSKVLFLSGSLLVPSLASKPRPTRPAGSAFAPPPAGSASAAPAGAVVAAAPSGTTRSTSSASGAGRLFSIWRHRATLRWC